jgi:hypothetical protein
MSAFFATREVASISHLHPPTSTFPLQISSSSLTRQQRDFDMAPSILGKRTRSGTDFGEYTIPSNSRKKLIQRDQTRSQIFHASNVKLAPRFSTMRTRTLSSVAMCTVISKMATQWTLMSQRQSVRGPRPPSMALLEAELHFLPRRLRRSTVGNEIECLRALLTLIRPGPHPESNSSNSSPSGRVFEIDPNHPQTSRHNYWKTINSSHSSHISNARRLNYNSLQPSSTTIYTFDRARPTYWEGSRTRRVDGIRPELHSKDMRRLHLC